MRTSEPDVATWRRRTAPSPARTAPRSTAAAAGTAGTGVRLPTSTSCTAGSANTRPAYRFGAATPVMPTSARSPSSTPQSTQVVSAWVTSPGRKVKDNDRSRAELIWDPSWAGGRAMSCRRSRRVPAPPAGGTREARQTVRTAIPPQPPGSADRRADTPGPRPGYPRSSGEAFLPGRRRHRLREPMPPPPDRTRRAAPRSVPAPSGGRSAFSSVPRVGRCGVSCRRGPDRRCLDQLVSSLRRRPGHVFHRIQGTIRLNFPPESGGLSHPTRSSSLSRFGGGGGSSTDRAARSRPSSPAAAVFAGQPPRYSTAGAIAPARTGREGHVEPSESAPAMTRAAAPKRGGPASPAVINSADSVRTSSRRYSTPTVAS